ncbi:hypothetical protein LSPCS325_51990 [Lysinibacillus sp. CTST325]
MLIKAYIKKHMFHLPMKQEALLEQVEQALNKDVDKSSVAKLNPLTKIEDNENILIEKQRTNIFFLNLLLLVLNHNEKDITDQEYYNDTFIISKLEEETELSLKALPFEGVEKEVHNYLNPTSDKLQIDDKPQIDTKSEFETKSEEGFSYLENIQFSVNWLKGAQKELNRRE